MKYNAEIFSVIAILISILLPLYLHSKSNKITSKKDSLNELKKLSLLISKTPEKKLYGIREKVGIYLDFSDTDIDFQICTVDHVENCRKQKALNGIREYKSHI